VIDLPLWGGAMRCQRSIRRDFFSSLLEPLLFSRGRGEGRAGLGKWQAAGHAPQPGDFSNIAHHIAAMYPSRRIGPNENGPDVKTPFQSLQVARPWVRFVFSSGVSSQHFLGSFRNFTHRQEALGSFCKFWRVRPNRCKLRGLGFVSYFRVVPQTGPSWVRFVISRSGSKPWVRFVNFGECAPP
jgi:hypothetical protein